MVVDLACILVFHWYSCVLTIDVAYIRVLRDLALQIFLRG